MHTESSSIVYPSYPYEVKINAGVEIEENSEVKNLMFSSPFCLDVETCEYFQAKC